MTWQDHNFLGNTFINHAATETILFYLFKIEATKNKNHILNLNLKSTLLDKILQLKQPSPSVIPDIQASFKEGLMV